MDLALILAAKYLFIVIALWGGLFFVKQKRTERKEILWFAFLNLPTTLAVGKLMGHLYYDPRPFVARHFSPLIPHAPDNGFPSDHALLSFAISAVILPFNRKLGIALALLGLLVGVARTWLGLHSPIDIFGSFIISASVASLVYFVGIRKLHWTQLRAGKKASKH